jgi:hypothetical protein
MVINTVKSESMLIGSRSKLQTVESELNGSYDNT